MSLRRWLTSRYDWTGISRLIYRSWKAELLAIIILALVTAAGFLTAGFVHGGSFSSYDGSNGAKAFLPSGKAVWVVIPQFWHISSWGVHLFDWVLAVVLLAFLLPNCARMWWFTIGRDKSLRVPISAYIRNIWQLPLQFFTQKRYAQCERKRPWALHLWLMLSYVTMLVLIMCFLEYMASGPDVDWRVHAFGLVAAAGLIITTIIALVGRAKKAETHYKHSHESDWMFLILLIIVATTGVLQFAMHRLGLDVAANVSYIVHLMAVVPMLGLEVPFSKWSHLAYRPLGMYFHAVREDAAMATVPAGEPLPAAQAA
jgi:quinone-modifying oxidoreductase subunit QmoC